MRSLLARVVRWFAFGRRLRALRTERGKAALRRSVEPLRTGASVLGSDPRAGRIVFLCHCALNQNARMAGTAEHPAAMAELVRGLLERGVGIHQMECPELRFFAADRERVPVRELFETVAGREACRALAREIADRIADYQQAGVRVLGILGKDGSPTCGVEETWEKGPRPGAGVFIEELEDELAQRSAVVPVNGVRDRDPAAALRIVDRWLEGPFHSPEPET